MLPVHFRKVKDLKGNGHRRIVFVNKTPGRGPPCLVDHRISGTIVYHLRFRELGKHPTFSWRKDDGLVGWANYLWQPVITNQDGLTKRIGWANRCSIGCKCSQWERSWCSCIGCGIVQNIDSSVNPIVNIKIIACDILIVFL